MKGKTAPASAGKNRMPTDQVMCILTQKPLVRPPHYALLNQSNPVLTLRPGEEADKGKKKLYSLAKELNEREERLRKLQAWVRAEIKTKGYVDVSDEWVDTADLNEMIDREWPKIQAKLDAIALKETSQGEGDENGCDQEDEDLLEWLCLSLDA